jgi:hypothetical protein
MIPGVAWKVAWLALAFLLSRVIVAVAWDATPPGAQTIHQAFQNGAPSGVTIRTRGSDVMPESKTRFTETGSGVLLSETGSARVVASKPTAADLSLLLPSRCRSGFESRGAYTRAGGTSR